MKTVIQRKVVRAVKALAPKVSFAVTPEGEIVRWPIEAGDPPTQQEIDDKIAEQEAQDAVNVAQRIEDEEDKVLVTGSADIRALVNLRPAQIEAWMEANVNTLAEAKTVMIRMAKVVSILAKIHLKTR